MIFIYNINYFNKYTVYFSYPKSWVMWAIIDLHDYLMFFIINIFLVVFIYMFLILFTQQNFFLKKNFIKNYVIFNAKDYNDEPLLEFFWTIFPALLLTTMSWPSFTLLYAMEQLIDPFHTVIITGNQWYWTYQYSDFDTISDIIIQLDSMKGLNYFSKIIKKELNFSVIFDETRFRFPVWYVNNHNSLVDSDISSLFLVKRYHEFKQMLNYILVNNSCTFYPNQINNEAFSLNDFTNFFNYKYFLEDKNSTYSFKKILNKKPVYVFNNLNYINEAFSNLIELINSRPFNFFRHTIFLNSSLIDECIIFNDLMKEKLSILSSIPIKNANFDYIYNKNFFRHAIFLNSSLIDEYIIFNDLMKEKLSILSFTPVKNDNFDYLYNKNFVKNTDLFLKFYSATHKIFNGGFPDYMFFNTYFELFKKSIVSSLIIKDNFNYWDLIQFIGKHARKYENTQLIYDAMLITDDNLPVGYPRLLCTDQVLMLPANVSIRLLITSNDVIHSWALPSHGIKMDAIPGRINQVPFLTPFWGTYWGQCSELCGINHGFMPIEVRVVCLEDYLSFIKLNISYKYDKFCPLVRNLIVSYILNLGNETNVINNNTANNEIKLNK